MKNLLLAVLCIVILASAGLGQSIAADERVIGRVIKVVDGDSLAVESEGQSYQVRLWGIDAPEWGQRFSADAKALCRDLVEGKIIAIEGKYLDRYDRVVAIVTVDGRVLNEEMISRGMAWVHIRYCDEEICTAWRTREQEARNLGRGLWVDRQPLAPWRWKSRQPDRRRITGR